VRVGNGIGNTMREARNRRKLDLSEVETATKIRIRYLRAIENEEWSVLPGGVYTRSFIRTYASYLGLDGERLAADHRDERAPRGDRVPHVDPVQIGDGPRGSRPRLPQPALTAIVCLAVGAVLIAVALSGGGSSSGPTSSTPSAAGSKQGGAGRTGEGSASAVRAGMSLSLATSAEVWVCLLAADGRPLVNGQVLPAGVEKGPFRSGSFTVSFGNGEVSMTIDGREAEIPATPSPIGYAVAAGGALKPLSEAERPTCT
jgi:cytoskeleton protein RodZ